MFIFILMPVSSWLLGYAAFVSGHGVKRWALLGLCLGPLAFPLLTTHQHLALRKIRSNTECLFKT